MLKHGAATQSEVADAETQSCYTVRGRKMLKHRAITQSKVADTETQKKPPELTMLKHKEAATVGRQCSQSAIHVAETARELRC
jgi:hypothetical protein